MLCINFVFYCPKLLFWIWFYIGKSKPLATYIFKMQEKEKKSKEKKKNWKTKICMSKADTIYVISLWDLFNTKLMLTTNIIAK